MKTDVKTASTHELEAEKIEIELMQREIQNRLTVVQTELYERQYGVKIGEVFNVNGNRFRVHSLSGSFPWLQIEKRGKWSQAMAAYCWHAWKIGEAKTPMRRR